MKQFVIIGCGRFGSSCAETLMDLGNEVLAIDMDDEIVESISEVVTHAVVMENISEESLKSLGVGNFDVAIVAISSNFEQAILSVVACRNLGVKEVIVKAKDKVHAEILKKIGADRTVIPESDSAVRLARSISSNSIFDYIEFDEKYSIIELIPKDEWVGKSLNDLKLRDEFGINIIAINSEDNSVVNVNPSASYVIKKNDFLIVAGENTKLDELTKDKEDKRNSLYKID